MGSKGSFTGYRSVCLYNLFKFRELKQGQVVCECGCVSDSMNT